MAGLTIGGSALVDAFADIPCNPCFGLILGGCAFYSCNLNCAIPVELTIPFTATGGLTLGGVSTAGFSMNGSGGLVIGGEVGLAASFNYVTTGGLVIGGTADAGLSSQEYLSIGGIVLSGEALVEISTNLSYVATGGLVLGGLADADFTYSFATIAIGGLVVSGTAISQPTLAYISDSGFLILNSDPGEFAFVTYNYITTGGLILGGTAAVQSDNIHIATGVLVLGGEAVAGILEFSYITSGGLFISGVAAIDREPDLTLGGVADVRRGFIHVSTGGLILGGFAIVISSEVVATGGLVLGSCADVLFTFNLDQEFTWDVHETLVVDLDVQWNVGEPRWFWWRFEGRLCS